MALPCFHEGGLSIPKEHRRNLALSVIRAAVRFNLSVLTGDHVLQATMKGGFPRMHPMAICCRTTFRASFAGHEKMIQPEMFAGLALHCRHASHFAMAPMTRIPCPDRTASPPT
jgi:ABC-type antimicrobial peptide transport system ATPase subunit